MKTNGKRILIVEDDQALAIALADAFKAEGAVVLGPAPTVFYAKQLIGRRGIDCALVGSDLPGDDVSLFIAQLATSGTPVITLSSSAKSGLQPSRDFVRPIDAADVVDSVAGVLNGHIDDDDPIELKSERAAKALGLDDNPHMRVVRIWTETMRRRSDDQKLEGL